ncbi:MAG: helix-turn-helix transcriptional regulator [Ignavibacteria bacterium]|nr:helix-turn-helix transcriptional regulator [Ignavibacteria bacterium]MCU7502329.1 helix-turn-helix transcriptional regulator [Ignavibacteria bacterium]MCU7515106.1 helix-turn-helix transcriptional regulator [Ignavibacteria bacterium]
MVCNRCIKVVKEELEKLGLEVLEIELGEVRVRADNFPYDEIRKVLEENGFELIEDKKAALINRVKSLIISLIYNDRLETIGMNISDFLEEKLNTDYQHLSTLFSSVENITIEHFVILQKLERAKELLKYNELTLSEIAYRLGYSSVQHLSSQFKKVTGLTASEFKALTDSRRKPIDKLT